MKFGPSGNSQSFFDEGYKNTVQAAEWVKNLGLDCYEYSFGRGVNMGEEKAIEIGSAFSKCGIEISVHAPYYINLANPDDEKAENCFHYIIDSAKMVKLMGGNRVIFHPAAQGKASRAEAFALTKKRTEELVKLIYENGLNDLIYCPETMGKIAQIGTVEEIAKLCLIDKILVPTVDFGHVNARENGSLKTEEDYITRLNYLVGVLGYERMKNFHVHFSKIQYSAKGEIRHLTFADTEYGPEFAPLCSALMKTKLEPHIICESAGTQAEDAVFMKKIYTDLL